MVVCEAWPTRLRMHVGCGIAKRINIVYFFVRKTASISRPFSGHETGGPQLETQPFVSNCGPPFWCPESGLCFRPAFYAHLSPKLAANCCPALPLPVRRKSRVPELFGKALGLLRQDAVGGLSLCLLASSPGFRCSLLPFSCARPRACSVTGRRLRVLSAFVPSTRRAREV